MGNYDWLMLNSSILNDYKVATLPDDHAVLLIECFLLACELDRGGLLPSLTEMSERLGIDLYTLEGKLLELDAAGLIRFNEVSSLGWIGPSWETRFFYGKRTSKYHEHLLTPNWRVRATGAKIEAGWQCRRCGAQYAETTLDAHHVTYANVGDEPPSDLEVICRQCHQTEHGKAPSGPIVDGGFHQSIPLQEWEL